MAFTAGVANVLVAPSFKGFQASIGKQVNTVMPAAGREAGVLFAQGMAQGIATGSGSIKAAAAAATYGATASASAAGAQAGAGFAAGMASGVRTAAASFSTATTATFAPSRAIAATAGTQAGMAFIEGARRAMIAGTGAFGAAGAAAAGGAAGPVRMITAAGAGAGGGFMSRVGSALSRGAAAAGGVAAGIGARMSAAVAGAGTAAGTGFLGGMARSLGPLAAILGPAAIIGSGWRRLTNIEDARASLEGLGHSADTVEQIMGDALSSVEGTAYGLDAAATLAANAVAAGIEPGAELERVLRLTGDAATIANVPLEQMGEIFGAVAGGNRLTMSEVNRLQQQGFPILQMLADHLGVASEEMREMVSAGEVGFADFADAIEQNVAGAALNAGDTTRGVFRNVGAAIGRFGATVLEPLMPTIRDLGERLIDFLDGAGERFQDFADWASRNSGWLTPLAVGIGAIAAATTLAAIAVGAFNIAWGLFSTAFGKTPIGRVVYLVIGLVAALITAWHTSETFRNVVTTVWEAIKTAVESVVGWFTNTAVPFLQGVWDAISAGATWMWENALKPAWDAIQAAWGVVASAISAVWQGVLKPAWDAVAAAGKWLWNTILRPVFSAIGAGFTAVGGFIFDVWRNVIKLAWDLLVYAARWMWNSVLKPIFGHISTGWSVVAAAIKVAWDRVLKPAWDAVSAAASWLWNNALRPAFDSISGAWKSMVDGIKRFWDNTLKPVWDAVAGFVEDRIAPGVQRGVDAIDRAWRSVANLFRAPINWVINTVWNDGLKKAFDNVATAINSDARLPAAPTIPRFAKGGLAQPGWAIVGEEGPELVNFTAPGRVYTATETARMMNTPGANPIQREWSESNPPHGGPMGWISSAASAVTGWVRGGLASMADALLSPLFNTVANTVGQWGPGGHLGGDAMVHVKNELVDWIRGKDDEGMAYSATDVAGRVVRGALPHVNAATWNISDAVGGFSMLQSINQSMSSGHRLGKAVDFMANAAKLQQAAAYMARNFQQLGLMQIIYNHRQNRGSGWFPYSGTIGNDPGHVWHIHGEWPMGPGPRLGMGRGRGGGGSGAAQVYDTGGDFHPGQLAVNLSRKPEVVLTNQHLKDVHSLASQPASDIRLHPDSVRDVARELGREVLAGARDVSRNHFAATGRSAAGGAGRGF